MRPVIAALLALLLVPSAQATAPAFEQALTPVQLQVLIAPAVRELAKSPVLRGAFVQRKFLNGMPKPLKSSGSFVVARAEGIYWHTQLPFDSEFILTPSSMVQLDGGATAIRISAEQQPGLRVIGDVFFSIFALDPTALSANFVLYGKAGKRGAWIMGLRPKNAALASAISAAAIHGNTRVEKVELWDAHGDQTEILLITSRSKVQALTPEEAALFRK